MDPATKSQIEELVRGAIDSQVASYREHLETQLNHLKWTVAIVAGLLALVAGFFAWGSYRELDAAARTLMVDYKLDDKLAERMTTLLGELESDAKGRLSSFVDGEFSKAVAQDAQKRIMEAVQDRADALEASDFKTQLAELPVGTIIGSMLSPEEISISLGESTLQSHEKSWVLADNAIVRGSQYAILTSRDRVPDLRGVFLRGINGDRSDGKGDVVQRNAGDYQIDALQTHFHRVQTGLAPRGAGPDVWLDGDFQSGRDTGPASGANVSTQETRPRNVAVYWYIKIN